MSVRTRCSAAHSINLLVAASLIAVSVAGCGRGAGDDAATGQRTHLDPVRHTVDADDGHPLAVWEKSPALAEGVILLVHGRTWSGLPDFDLQVPGEDLSLMDGLVEEGFATYAVDMRGYGGTPRDDTGWLTPSRAAADLANVLEWLGEERGGALVLFGWSYGSMISQLLVQRRPELASALILFGYPGSNRTWSDDGIPTEPARRVNTAEAAASDFIVPGAISQVAIDAYIEAALAADPVRTDWREVSGWSELDPALVTVPTLILQGEFDPIATTESQADFMARAAAPDRRWVVIPGGDHAAFMETPRPVFIDALVGFLRRPR